MKPVDQNDLALKNGFLLFSELAERTQTSGSSQGIGDRAGSGVTRNGQMAVLAEHSSEGEAGCNVFMEGTIEDTLRSETI